MLGTLASQLERRVDALEMEMMALLGRPLAATDRRQAEHIIFQLQNVWEIHVRNFILISATGRATGGSGQIPASIPRKYRSREAACHFLLLTSRNRYEPKWYRPTDAIRAATTLRLANLADVAAAIGSTPWPLEDLRLIRNFFAHRSRSSALELRALGWFQPGDTISIETTLMPYVPGGVRRFNNWCSAMKAVSRAML